MGSAMPGEPMRALTWIAKGHESTALAELPAVCLASDDAQVVAGRAMFHAPELLGGQAARADISCASCHTNGRTNPHFFLAGVSSTPGTADVSASFFSPARGNGRFDPKPIPDLALPGKISRAPDDPALERFLRNLIVEEFAGNEPSPAMLRSLGAYVRAIRGCEGADTGYRQIGDQLQLVRDSMAGAEWFLGQGDTAAAQVLLKSTRTQLGLIHERYAGPQLARERALLQAASRELQPMAASTALDQGALGAWQSRFEKRVAPRLVRSAARSLYNPAELARKFPS